MNKSLVYSEWKERIRKFGKGAINLGLLRQSVQTELKFIRKAPLPDDKVECF